MKHIFYIVVALIALVLQITSLWFGMKSLDEFKRNEFMTVAVLFEVIVWGGIIMAQLTSA